MRLNLCRIKTKIDELFRSVNLISNNRSILSRHLSTSSYDKISEKLTYPPSALQFNVKHIKSDFNNNLRLGISGFSREFRTSCFLCESVIISTPEFPESVQEGDIRWIKDIGSSVVVDEVLCEIETDKTAIPVPSTVNGVLVERYIEDGEAVKQKQKICKIEVGEGGDKKPAAKAKDPPKKSEATPPSTKPPSAAPSKPPAERPHKPPPLPPTKPPPTAQTPVTPKPAKVPDARQSVTSPVVKIPSQKPTQEIVGTRSEYKVKINRMRMKIADRLKAAQNTYAMLTTFNEIDMSYIIQFRKANQDAFVKKYGVKLGFMSLFIKASCYALQDQPVINAVIDGNEIVYRDYVDISVAIASPKGLVVPVLRNVTNKNFADIEKEIIMFSKKAKDNRLAVEDMDGGTFTISNGGVFGSLMGTPIINPPQSAILGMHATVERPVAIKGQVVIKPMMYVALTYDHRLIDGREAVLFLRKIKEAVENPPIMLAGL